MADTALLVAYNWFKTLHDSFKGATSNWHIFVQYNHGKSNYSLMNTVYCLSLNIICNKSITSFRSCCRDDSTRWTGVVGSTCVFVYLYKIRFVGFHFVSRIFLVFDGKGRGDPMSFIIEKTHDINPFSPKNRDLPMSLSVWFQRSIWILYDFKLLRVLLTMSIEYRVTDLYIQYFSNFATNAVTRGHGL